MGVYINVSRFKRDESFVLNESLIYDLIEVDYNKINKYKIGETISFRNGIMTVNYLSNHNFKSDWGIYDNSEFFFYTMAVSPDFGISYRNKDAITIVGLFKPEKIIKVITIILQNKNSLSEAQATDDEFKNLVKLQKMLEEAQKERDYILLMWE